MSNIFITCDKAKKRAVINLDHLVTAQLSGASIQISTTKHDETFIYNNSTFAEREFDSLIQKMSSAKRYDVKIDGKLEVIPDRYKGYFGITYK